MIEVSAIMDIFYLTACPRLGNIIMHQPDMVLRVVVFILDSRSRRILLVEVRAIDEKIKVSTHAVADTREAAVRRQAPVESNVLGIHDATHQRNPDGAKEMLQRIAVLGCACVSKLAGSLSMLLRLFISCLILLRRVYSGAVLPVLICLRRRAHKQQEAYYGTVLLK